MRRDGRLEDRCLTDPDRRHAHPDPQREPRAARDDARCRPPVSRSRSPGSSKEEGYIKDYRIKKGESFDTLVVELKFGRNRERVITDLKRISKPGRRIYARKDRLPRVLGGMGTAILSTSRGVVTSRAGRRSSGSAER